MISARQSIAPGGPVSRNEFDPVEIFGLPAGDQRRADTSVDWRPEVIGGEYMTGALARPTVVTRTSQTRPVVMVGVLVLSDAIALIVSVVLGVLLKVLLVGHTGLDGYLRLWPFVFVFIAFYSAVGLYSGAALSPPEELRRATFSSAFLFPTIAALTASWRGPSRYVTPALFVALFTSIVLVPLFRAIVR